MSSTDTNSSSKSSQESDFSTPSFKGDSTKKQGNLLPLTPQLAKQGSLYSSYFTEKDSEINKLLEQSLKELTNNPNNLENKAEIQSLIPISVLLEEMRSDYSTTRTYCLENLETIALALGPAKAKGLLGGFISNLLKDQDEGVEEVPEEMQVMLTLLQSLPKLINLIGGPKQARVILEPLLDTLPDRQKEESRVMYLKTIKSIFEQMAKTNSGEGEAFLYEKVQQFSEGSQQEQVAASNLICHLFSLVKKETQNLWRKAYEKICTQSKDQNVKKKSITNLSELMRSAQSQSDLVTGLEILKTLQSQISDVHKGQLLYSLPIFLQKQKVLSFLQIQEGLGIFTQILTLEKSSIQIILMEIINELLVMEYYTSQGDQTLLNIIECYLLALQSNETDLKNKSAANIEPIIVFLKKNEINRSDEFIQRIFVRIKELLAEKSTNTKLILTDNITSLIKQNSQILTIAELVQLRQYTSDILAQSDGEFRYKFLQKQSSFEYLIKLIQQTCKNSNQIRECCLQYVQIICSIQQQKNWRMRQQCCILIQKVIYQCQSICKFLNDQLTVLGNNGIDEKNLMEFNQTIKLSIQDRISTVRDEGAKVNQIIYKDFKTLNYMFWISRSNSLYANKILDSQHEIYTSLNYLYRTSYALGLKNAFLCFDFSDNSILRHNILQIVQDRIPNVKIALLETIFFNYQYRTEARVKRWIPFLKEILYAMTTDNDLDVCEASKNIYYIF